MMGLSAAYCSEIALSNPKRFVTVKDESTENRRRCSTKKTKITAHISTEKKRKERHSCPQENSQDGYRQKIAGPWKIRIHLSPTNFNDGVNWVWDIRAWNEWQVASAMLKKFDSLLVLSSYLVPNLVVLWGYPVPNVKHEASESHFCHPDQGSRLFLYDHKNRTLELDFW